MRLDVPSDGGTGVRLVCSINNQSVNAASRTVSRPVEAGFFLQVGWPSPTSRPPTGKGVSVERLVVIIAGIVGILAAIRAMKGGKQC